MPAIALAAVSIAGTVAASKSASKASKRQQASADAGIAEQQHQFDTIQELLSPYVDAGKSSLAGQLDLLGLNGNNAQGKAVDSIENSQQFKSIYEQGENAILQNASATGGIRGGNTQAALGQFRPQMLSQLIEQQYGRLGGITSVGQNAAAGVGNAGLQTGNNITGLLQQQGAAQAGNALAQGQAIQQGIGGLAQAYGYSQGATPYKPPIQSF